jgi:acetyl-CoA carboxylase/biotin carboxylase 1
MASLGAAAPHRLTPFVSQGWGHASENPKLPATLAHHNIVFIGPAATAMDAVGDKICANLLAQSVGVNVIPWSGSGLTVPDITIPADTLRKATLKSVEEALECVKRVGYPCMIKASEGGGGKGIRKVNSDEEMIAGFGQVQAEVPGSPVFIQKLSTESRHLEVQMIADGQGAAIALYGRDCSVQRRHQKIIEEGPYCVAPPKLQRELEQGAVRLAKKVGYRGAGTVEYLYNMRTGEYSFLEVNPRLQVEHPVTEHITGVNIPSVQLQIAMGVPMHRIADVRRFFGLDPVGTDKVDFDALTPNAPIGHCMAARITAENPEDGFKPTSGAIHELGFRGVPGVTAYFSVGPSNSGVHQFADSQFGHVFALAPTRDASIALLVSALSDLSIRGEIHTNTKYLMSLLERDAFRADTHDTAWLDGLIAQSDRAARVEEHIAVICGAVMVADDRHCSMQAAVLASLERGVAPEAHAVNLSEHSFELIYNDLKYRLRVTMGGPLMFYIWLNGDMVETEVMKLPDGGLTVLLDGRTHLVYREPCKVGLMAHVDGWPCFFPEDVDPTRMSAPSTGKLLRYLVPSGGYVTEGQPYVEIEAMKMVMPLLATSTGTITHTRTPGAALDAGDVLCTVMLEDPTAIKTADLFTGRFPPLQPRRLTAGIPEGSFYLKFHVAVAGVRRLLGGYDCTGDPLDELLEVMASPLLVADDFNEQRAAVSARAPAPALAELDEIGQSLRTVCATWSGPKRSLAQLDDVALAVKQVAEWLDRHGADAYAELASFLGRYEHGLYAHECAVLTSFLTGFLDVEQPFAAAETFADAVLALAAAHKGDLAAVAALAHSHAKLPRKNALILRVLDAMDASNMADAEQVMSAITRFIALQRAPSYASVAQRAKAIILRKQEESRDTARRWKTMQTSLVKSMPYIKEMGASYSGGSEGGESVRHSVSGYLTPAEEDESGTPRTAKLAALRDAASNRRGSDSVVPKGAGALAAAPSGDEGGITWASLFDYAAPDTQLAALKQACEALGVQRATATVAGGTVRAALYPGMLAYVAPSLSAVPALLAAHGADDTPAAGFIVSSPGLADASVDALATSVGDMLRDAAGVPEALEQAWVTLVCVGVPHASFAFVRAPSGELREEPLFRNCLPSVAHQLELGRLATFQASCLSLMEPRNARGGARTPRFFQAGDYRLGVYLAEEKALQGKSQRDRRLFVRAAVYNKALLLPRRDGTASPAGALFASFSGLALSQAAAAGGSQAPRRRRRGIAEDNVLADVLGSMELAVGQHRTAWNFIFVNLVDGGPEDIEATEEVVHAFTEQCFEDLQRLKVAWIEVKVGPGRVVAQNKTSYHYSVEYHADTAAPRPYPVLTKLQRKRMVAQQVNTTYCYDFLELFAFAVKRDLSNVDPALLLHELPPFAATELALAAGSRTKLEAVTRPSGSNDCGVVVWRCTYASAAYAAGRDFILVANDITHQSGSFSPAEDDVYVAAFKLAEAEGLPCVYISANSGARIGLDEAVKGAFKAAWVDPADPSLGFKYLYLDDADYSYLKEKGSAVMAEALTAADGATHWVLRDVPGGLGQECLQGSGAIASVTSEAYANIFTLTYVTARSVSASEMDIAALLRVLTQAPYSLRFRRSASAPTSRAWVAASSSTRTRRSS